MKPFIKDELDVLRTQVRGLQAKVAELERLVRDPDPRVRTVTISSTVGAHQDCTIHVHRGPPGGKLTGKGGDVCFDTESRLWFSCNGGASWVEF